MTITITINTDNDAFSIESGGPEQEVARILSALAYRLKDGSRNETLGPMKLRDINGNTCGAVTVTGEPDGNRRYILRKMGHAFVPPPIQGSKTRMHVCAKCGEPASAHMGQADDLEDYSDFDDRAEEARPSDD